ncbi:hypothetical protein K443DRAFT_10649 [Laccaria amethystina LaAM-08-1]|uniref:Uncharacterized protein n=1 Tax=Laccaria amethystina LaAM-08-1 TaxID=1095629 RepID=A0A0C9XJQ4_9AGAR|nr:hypothetical protein K443DRAFT_10649 [Laccaria amethystina LaAM-08-1]
MYLAKCKELQIEPNPRGKPKSEDDKPSDGTRQTSLDGFVQGVASVKWSKEGLIEHILDFVVSDDQLSIRSLSEDSFSTNVQPQKTWILDIGTASVEDEDDEDDIDDLEAEWLSDWIGEDENPDEQEPDDDVVDFTAGDVLGKALALVNQVRASPQAQQYFALCCESEHVAIVELKKWVRTRWGSMYDLIERFTSCKPALQKFCVFADEKLPNLKNKKYADYKFEPDEWKMLDLIQEVLAEPRHAQASFSFETEPTLWKTIPMLELLDALEKGLERLRKWYRSLDHSDTSFICLALHPSIKDRYCKENWETESYDRGYASLVKAFDSYYQHPENPTSSSTAGASNEVNSKAMYHITVASA